MNTQEFYRQLVRRYRDGTASDEELEVFANLMENQKLDPYLAELFNEELHIVPARKKTFRWYRIAAAILLFASIGLTVWYWQNNDRNTLVNNERPDDIGPAVNQAILKLANGRQIVLDSAGGVIRVGAGVINANNGDILYQENTDATAQEFHNITVPRGGKYQVELSDGTRVWLNSGSTLRFPIAFNSTSRNVELIGEGFFEVSKVKNAKGLHVPFTVQTGRQRVEVLGTSFNIMAYSEAETETATLFTGRINVKDNTSHNNKILIPGQQAVFEASKSGFHIEAADLESIGAWKEGFFMFNETPINEVIRQLAVWYNVQIDYVGDNKYKFNGYIERDIPISKVLDMIKKTGDFNLVSQGRNIRINQL